MSLLCTSLLLVITTNNGASNTKLFIVPFQTRLHQEWRQVSCVRHQSITQILYFEDHSFGHLFYRSHIFSACGKPRENNILCPHEPPGNGRAHRLASPMTPLATSMRALDSATRFQGRGKIRTPLQQALLAAE